MRLTREGGFERTDIWREGDYLDLWSVPHFLSGMGVAFALFFLDFATNAAFVIAFLLLVAYEMFEVIAKIHETRWNRILDVVVGMASFAPTYFLAALYPVEYVAAVFAGIVILDSYLSFLGWRASQKASTLETKLRAEFEREKERFFAHKERVRARWRHRKRLHARVLARLLKDEKRLE